jgi:CelD/BcsL family acetyltransferase involved in cellulose biosynthesis
MGNFTAQYRWMPLRHRGVADWPARPSAVVRSSAVAEARGPEVAIAIAGFMAAAWEMRSSARPVNFHRVAGGDTGGRMPLQIRRAGSLRVAARVS